MSHGKHPSVILSAVAHAAGGTTGDENAWSPASRERPIFRAAKDPPLRLKGQLEAADPGE
jgi:hypothetical protein